MRETQATISTTPGGETEWGIGWELSRPGGLRAFAHGGGTLGQVTHTLGIPERGFAISVMTNSLKGGQLIEKIEKWVLERHLGLTVTTPQAVELDAEQLRRLAGVYETTLSKTTVAIDDGQLTASVTMRHPLTGEEMQQPPVRLTPVGDWEVLVLEDGEPGGVAQFIPGPDGRASHLRLGRLAARVE
jgi:hypothetical protein